MVPVSSRPAPLRAKPIQLRSRGPFSSNRCGHWVHLHAAHRSNRARPAESKWMDSQPAFFSAEAVYDIKGPIHLAIYARHAGRVDAAKLARHGIATFYGE